MFLVGERLLYMAGNGAMRHVYITCRVLWLRLVLPFNPLCWGWYDMYSVDGSPEDLRKTAAFVQETGVDIQMWKKKTT